MEQGHPDAIFYPYTIFKKFIPAVQRVRDDNFSAYKKLIAFCARAAQCEQKDFERFIKG